MRVVLAPIGTRGDVAPLVALGSALRGAGHEVSACVTRDFASLFTDVGIASVPIDADAAAFVQDLDGGLRDIVDLGRRLRPAAVQAQNALDEACRDADVVVGSGFQILAPALCEARRIRYVYGSTSPTLERSTRIPPHFAPFYGLGPLANWLLWRGQDVVLARLFQPILGDYREALGRTRRAPNLWDALTAPTSLLRLYDAAIVGAGFESGALGACFGGAAASALPDALQAFLERGTPPVLVTVGSVAGPDVESRIAAVAGAVRGAGHRLLLDGASSIDDDDVCVIGEVDYLRLFPRLGAVVHHGGAGTVAIAARAGVPQVVVPHVVDQFFWGRRVAATGIGSRPVPSKRLTESRVARALAEATAEPVVRAAGTMAARLSDIDGPAAAAAALERDYVSR